MALPREVGKSLYYIPKISRWSTGIGAELPEEYKKFWKEWKIDTPAPVHFIPKEGKYEKKPDGVVQPVQNVPLPLKYPKEIDEGIWGGEAVVQGFYKSSKYTRRVVHYWTPVLQKSVVYSEILNKYMRMIVTNRTLELIHAHYGFDHYILKTKACDLRSLLALQLKREMLINLADKTLYLDDPVKQNEIYEKYKHYLESYTRKEIEWYGLSYPEACKKHIKIKLDNYNPVPLKVKYREEFLKQLRGEGVESEDFGSESTKSTSWLSKINPFSSSGSRPTAS